MPLAVPLAVPLINLNRITESQEVKMPISINGFQRVIVQGIPVWKNSANEYYAYESDVTTNPIRLGSETEGFTVNWTEFYSARLDAYRNELASRKRAVSSQKK